MIVINKLNCQLTLSTTSERELQVPHQHTHTNTYQPTITTCTHPTTDIERDLFLFRFYLNTHNNVRHSHILTNSLVSILFHSILFK